MADGCLWVLAPQSCPSPKCAAYPTAAFGEHWEPRLSARCGHWLVRYLGRSKASCFLEGRAMNIPTALRTPIPETMLALAPRRIAFRTGGRAHGGITRLVSPSNIGELIKPFV